MNGGLGRLFCLLFLLVAAGLPVQAGAQGEVRDQGEEQGANKDEMPPGEDEMPPGEDEMPPGEEEMPPGGDEMPPGEDEMPPGEEEAATERDSEEAVPLAPVVAPACVAPLKARGIIKFHFEKPKSIDLHDARVEAQGRFGPDACLARASLVAQVNEGCEIRADLEEQIRNQLQVTSMRLVGHSCPGMKLPQERFLMSGGQVAFRSSGEVLEQCVSGAKLLGAGWADLRASSGQSVRIEFMDVAIEGDVLGQREQGLACGRRGRSLELGLDAPKKRSNRKYWVIVGVAATVAVVGGGVGIYLGNRPEPTTGLVIDLR